MMGEGGKVLIVAGEASADGYGARLIAALKRLRPGVDVYGVGGAALREEGARLMVDNRRLSTFGVFELFKLLPRLIGILIKVLNSIGREGPDLVILIDYPDFNLRLARFIRWRYGRNLKILYYITPQVWIWRKRRAKTLAKLVDRVAVVFPFEEPIFKSLGVKTDFVGHPLLETVTFGKDRESLRKVFNLDPERRVIALLPGSRHGEINNYLPQMVQAARELNEDGDYQFLLPRAPTISEEEIARHLTGNGLEIRQVSGNAQDALRAADMAVVALGTATLEAALMGTPAVLVGRVHPLTRWFGVKFLELGLQYYGLVNFILGRCAFPELIQEDMTGSNIARAVRELMANPRAMELLREAAAQVEATLRKGQDTVSSIPESSTDEAPGLPPCASSRAAILAHTMMN